MYQITFINFRTYWTKSLRCDRFAKVPKLTNGGDLAESETDPMWNLLIRRPISSSQCHAWFLNFGNLHFCIFKRRTKVVIRWYGTPSPWGFYWVSINVLSWLLSLCVYEPVPSKCAINVQLVIIEFVWVPLKHNSCTQCDCGLEAGFFCALSRAEGFSRLLFVWIWTNCSSIEIFENFSRSMCMFCEFLCGFDEQYVVAADCVCVLCVVCFFVALTSSM